MDARGATLLLQDEDGQMVEVGTVGSIEIGQPVDQVDRVEFSSAFSVEIPVRSFVLCIRGEGIHVGCRHDPKKRAQRRRARKGNQERRRRRGWR